MTQVSDNRRKQAMTIQEGKNPIGHHSDTYARWLCMFGRETMAAVIVGLMSISVVWSAITIEHMVVVEGATKKKKKVGVGIINGAFYVILT